MKENLKYWRIIAVALLPLALYFIPRDNFFEHQRTLCLFDNLLGRECWGCGMSRALLSLMYLDFEAAWNYHHGVVVVAPILMWLWGKRIVWEVRRVKDSCANEK